MLIGIDASRATRTLPTGTEAYSSYLIRAIVESNSPHRIVLYSPTQPSPMIWDTDVNSPNGVSVAQPDETKPTAGVSLRTIPFPRLWTHARLGGELLLHPPDVLFVPSHVVPIICPVPAVATVHDLGYLYYPEAHRAFDRWYLDWSTRRQVRRNACTIADSLATRNDLIANYDADPDRIVVVYPGRDETLSRIEDQTVIDAVKIRYGIQGDYLLYLGTLQPRKNLSRLIEAFSILLSGGNVYDDLGDSPSHARSTDSLQLVLAGKKGWLYDDIFQQVESFGLSDRVIFTGYVDGRDKPALLSGALALAFPSLYEGFGMPVLEAMACGTPVLTSKVSSLPEVAGDAALTVDPLDVYDIAGGLRILCQQADLRQSLIKKGYRQVNKFSWTESARQVLEVLESVVPSN